MAYHWAWAEYIQSSAIFPISRYLPVWSFDRSQTKKKRYRFAAPRVGLSQERNASLAPAYRVPIPIEIAAWRLPTSRSFLHLEAYSSTPEKPKQVSTSQHQNSGRDRVCERGADGVEGFAHGGRCG